jgi:hypothetical protein
MSERLKRVKSVLTNKWAKEFYRMAPFLGIIGFVLIPDSSSSVVLFGVGIISLAVLVAHLIRKILFPYFDMQKLADGIEEDPKASAAVICAIIFLVVSIINSFVTLLR